MRLLLLVLFCCQLAVAQSPPDSDGRYAEILHSRSVFRMPSYESAEAWQDRAEHLRRQLRWAAGIDPMPERTPLNPIISTDVSYDGYTVQNVLIETLPGFYLGGNLYRPNKPAQERSAILLSHGHWAYGRLEHSNRASGPTLAANLAMQGHVVFAHDMVGYNDTMQHPHDSLGSSREELWNVHLLGLQSWNSVRALDFLETLSGVDKDHIYTAGASGGGTQAFLLGAMDERVKAAAFVNMVSFHYQGGGKCETAPGLRIGTNNVEIATMMAPRPLLLVSATGDWTVNTPNKEYPAVRSIYELLGKQDSVEMVQIDAPHNFNQQSREAVYSFFDPQHRKIEEKSIKVPQPSQLLSLWGESLPDGAVRSPDELIELLMTRAQSAAAGSPSLERLRLALKAEAPDQDQLLSSVIEEWRNGESFAVSRAGVEERVPGTILQPRRARDWVKPTLMIHPEGAAWAMSSAESRDGFVANLLSRGGSVMAVDVFQSGHKKIERRIADAGGDAERVFTALNLTDTTHRVQDVLTAITYAQQRFETEQIQLICPGEAGLWCLLARALVDAPIDTVIDWQRFDADSDEAYLDRLAVPGIRKAGGLNAAVALWSGGRKRVFDTERDFPADVDARPTAIDWDELLEWAAPRRRPR